ncbi:hypothetical protein BGZ96_006521 [Linnemannia gamsii]|uniref:F-box domain-containing protein n=1 Tax=Linnemannia gamsii TaxID=64522 RepID=A0ABQ7K2A0_9FUNG|nr:hypothetical protein BGZ96_006521 [Linnemannia gamsii]
MPMTIDSQKPSHCLTSAGPLRISSSLPPCGLAVSHSNYVNTTTVSSSEERRIPDLPARKRALEIPEIVLLIQEQLDRPSLLVSLRITSLWNQIGRHLVWHTVDWDNATNNVTHSRTVEDKMLENSHRIRTLRCMFHSQAGTSYADSSALLRTLLTTSGGERGEGDSVRTKALRTLSLRGHFSLQSIGSRLVSSTDTTTSPLPLLPSTPRYIPFLIPSLAHLDIRPSVNSAVDLHLILNTAIGLRTLVIDSHGSFVDSNNVNNNLDTFQSAQGAPQGLEGITSEHQHPVYPVHEALVSLKIQHLKMSRQELESVAARCLNLVEFQSHCSSATLWKLPPGSQHPQQQQYHHQQQQQQQEQEQLNSRKSLVTVLAKLCPKIQRFHVGLQQGGFHTDLVRDTLTAFPGLVSFGLPATDSPAPLLLITIIIINIDNNSNIAKIMGRRNGDGYRRDDAAVVCVRRRGGCGDTGTHFRCGCCSGTVARTFPDNVESAGVLFAEEKQERQ